jgi:tRNA A37 threonylcarbamoyladenosine dehydratase
MSSSSTKATAVSLIGCFLAGATSAYVVTTLIQNSRKEKEGTLRQRRKQKSNASITIPKHLREEQLSRHTLYFGDDGMESIKSSNVCVVGLGGVGSHCAVMLARGGVTRNLRLIDFDQVTLSSLNRHACATLHDVGIPKVTCVKRFCEDLGVPSENIDARVEMYTEDTGPTLLQLPEGEKWDVIVDCIDDVPTKAALLSYCIQHNIRVLSCMGAGGKSDMTRLHISDLRTASRDPLASKLRQTMKRKLKSLKDNNNATDGQTNGSSFTMDDSFLDDMDQLTIIYSSEKTVAKLADLSEEQKAQGDKSQFGSVDNMRIRVLPVLGPIPAIFGQSLAAIVLCELGKKPIHQPVTGERVSKNVRHKLFQHLMNREVRIRSGELRVAGGVTYTGRIEIDEDDVEYLYGVWRNKCGVTGARLGTTLSLVRWDTSKAATIDNLVLMSAHAMKAYDEKGREDIPEQVQRRIEQRLAACRDPNSSI